MADENLKVDFTGLDGVQESLATGSTNLVANVGQAEPAIVTGSNAHPAFATSAVNLELLKAHGNLVYQYAGQFGDLAGGVGGAGATYTANETRTAGIAAMINQGGS